MRKTVRKTVATVEAVRTATDQKTRAQDSPANVGTPFWLAASSPGHVLPSRPVVLS